MTREAGVIFAGTVVEARNLGLQTEVIFREIRALKGVQADSVALLLMGGTVGGRELIGDQSMFRAGGRYIVFAWDFGSRRNSYGPVMNFGLFGVSKDSHSTRGIVYDWLGNPLIRFSADQAVEMWLDSKDRPAIRDRLAQERRREAESRSEEKKSAPWLTLWEFEDPGTRVTEDEFISVVEGILREAAGPNPR